ncbi:MAG TPA: 2,3-bisphosphoglycerate-independent phosphoglycerate mutase [Tepidisphaeraceae bacterium]|jgi:2,3-bisphosphoglycerate-independent phosphoglycerate mutase|nr:2,3-bisphosphoglycerate-independent phosphoglycerate mutase [Tepidisphaeraceae bacterium]
MSVAVTKRPLVLIVRDGWGRNPDPKWNGSNAVYLAKKPVDDRLMAEYPHTLVATSGFDVGLPEGTMGNSEVGHQNIGAGRVVDQESVGITKQARSGEIFNNVELNAAVTHAMENGGSLHLFGIVSDAGVHGLLEHLYACLELAKRRGMTRVYLHAFTDGRDTSPNSGVGYIEQVEAKMREIGVGQIATVSGRYYAMDRDNRWPRVEKAYRAIRYAEGPRFGSALEAVRHYYANPVEPTMTGDEFVTPSVIVPAAVQDGDSVIFYNYRTDRPRELTQAFVQRDFAGFDRGELLKIYFTTMTAYQPGLAIHVAFPDPPMMSNIIGEYLANLGLRQFRCAETEKFPHVTFFFNARREAPFPGEDRQIIPSAKVSTYDQLPEMSAGGITEEVIKRIESKQYDLIVVNYANGDMVGHTGSLPAAIRAVESVDAAVGEVLEAVKKVGGVAIVTADHGNAEQMINPATGGPDTAHTTFTVPVILVDDRLKGKVLRAGGRLADLAPTALKMMGLGVPAEMTGKGLFD